MNNLNSLGEKNYFLQFFSSNSNVFKSFSKESKVKSSIFQYSSNIKNKKIFALFSQSNEPLKKSKEELFHLNREDSPDDNQNINDNESMLSFSKLKDFKSSKFYSDGKKDKFKVSKVINIDNKRGPKFIISDNKITNKNTQKLLSDKKTDNNIKEKSININKEKKVKKLLKNNNKLLNKKRKRAKHTYLYSDNLKEKIKTSFFNSIFEIIKKELETFKKLKPFYIIPNIEKVRPILESLNKDENFKNALLKKVKDIFYTDETLDIYYKNRYKEAEKYIKRLKKIEIINKNNKEIINKIEENMGKLNEEKNEKIKNSILKLNEIFNASLNEMYLQYIHNNIHFENFKTIKKELERQKTMGKNDNYLNLFKEKSKKIHLNIEKNK